MKLCVVSFKECWQDQSGHWYSTGGFPLQMAAVGSLFDEMVLVVIRGPSRQGGIALPVDAKVVAMRKPAGRNSRRKLSVLVRLPYYFSKIMGNVRACDVVHVPVPGDIAFLGMISAFMMRKRLIARYGSAWESTGMTTPMNQLTKGLMRVFAGGRNVMLATGVGDSPPAPRMHWIFTTAISEAEIQSVQPDLTRDPQSPLQLAYVGRLSPEKGVIYLVQALGQLRRDMGLNDKSMRLTIIGDGPQKPELVQLAKKLDCLDWIWFAGQLNRDQLMSHLIGMDICVLPSLTESFGKARLDALLCGVPVITTNVGFANEIVGSDEERGWLVARSDARDLANTLHGILLKQPDWVSIRKRCRRFAERLTLEDWTRRIGNISAQQWKVRMEDGKIKA